MLLAESSGVGWTRIGIMIEGAPDPKKRRFSHEPDLKVAVEDDIFHVHSWDLISASDVFAQMLESDMRECEEGQITLPGKSKEDFRVLLSHLRPVRAAAFPDITDENVLMLLQWADEYQIEGLIARCETLLMNSLPHRCGEKEMVTQRMNLAMEYSLEKLRGKCEELIRQNLFDYRKELVHFVSNASLMKKALPALFKAAGLPDASDDYQFDVLEVHYVWPLVIRAIEAMKEWKNIKDMQVLGEHIFPEHLPEV